MKTRYLAILATLAFLGFSVPAPALADPVGLDGCHGPHKPCVPDPAPSEGGKAFLFEIAATDICEPVIVNPNTSFGHVSWSGNVLWDSINIHAHFKLQLKDVNPGDYPILGNNDIECVDGVIDDIAICESDEVEPCEAKSITVKEGRRQGRTSGALRLPGCDPDEPTTVWVTVAVIDGNTPRILRSTPVTVVLPPNEVGTGQSCPLE